MGNSETVILRGTERYHMENYLTLRGYRQEAPTVWRTLGVKAVFKPARQIPLGSFTITEVEVTFEGDAETVADEVARFRLQFLTAGG